MNTLKQIILAATIFITGIAFGQEGQSAYYQRAAKLCEEAAKKYDALKCYESAAYCRKMRDWNNCMVSQLAGKSCGPEPLMGNAPTCAAAMPGGSNGNSNSSSSNKADPIKEMQLKQQQLQQELNNAQNASVSAYENAINSGKKTSGAMVDATLSGAQYLSDPKTSLAYTGIGLGVAGLAALHERKEAKRLARLEELKAMKESLPRFSNVFDFISGATDYHITSLRVEKKKNGRIKNITRSDLYDITVTIHKIVNSADSVVIYESVAFKNINSSTDSFVISRIAIPLQKITNVQAYNGNYTNSFDRNNNAYENYRYKELDNSSIEYAFSMQGDYPVMPSGLTDVYIETAGSNIRIQKKYLGHRPYTPGDMDFSNVYSYSSSNYMLVFDELNDKIKDFVDYLNYAKN